MFTSKSITPIPAKNSEATSIGTATACDPWARGTRIAAAGKTIEPTRMAGPTPSHRPARSDSRAPTSAPTAASESANPIRPGESPRVRVAYRMMMANSMRLKKFSVAAHPRQARRIGFPKV